MRKRLYLFVSILIVCLMCFFQNILSWAAITYATLFINVIGLLWFLKKYRYENIVCFELFFSIVFFLVTYSLFFITPYKIAGWGATMAVDHLSYTGDNFYKLATLYSSLGYLMFLLGATQAYNKKIYSEPYNINKCNKRIEKTFLLFSIITFLFFIIFDYKEFVSLYQDTPDAYSTSYISWFSMMYLNYLICVFINARTAKITSINKFIKQYPACIISFILLEFLYLSSGHRTQAIGLFLPFIFLFSHCIKKLSGKAILMLCVVGFFVLIIIGQTRSGNGFNATTLGEFLIDFSGASVATSFFLQYVSDNGITFGTNYLIKILGAVPFLAGFCLSLGLKVEPDSFITYTDFFMSTGSGIGMGTSLIGDLYYSFGLPGIIILMFILGYIVSILFKKIVDGGNYSPYILICIAVLMSQSYFMPRNDYVSFIRPLAFQCLFYYIVSHIMQK